jgi:hypothetical protein
MKFKTLSIYKVIYIYIYYIFLFFDIYLKFIVKIIKITHYQGIPPFSKSSSYFKHFIPKQSYILESVRVCAIVQISHVWPSLLSQRSHQ